MLTFIFARESSARRRVISACCGLTAQRPAATVNCPAWYCFSSVESVLAIRQTFAPSAVLMFLACLCRTTLALNSTVNTRRFSCSFLLPSNALFCLAGFIILHSLSTQRKAYRIIFALAGNGSSQKRVAPYVKH